MRGVKYVSFATHTGYSIAARAYARALAEAGVPLTWRAHRYEAQTDAEASQWGRRFEDVAHLVDTGIDYDTVVLHLTPDCYPDWLERERAPGRRILGYTVWELDTLPREWPALLNRLDGVIVPCSWNVEVFRRSGVTVPIHVVPHLSQFEWGSEPTEAERLRLESRLGDPSHWRGKTVFYNVSHWIQRKAPHLALAAYLRAFTIDDPVFMVIKTTPKDESRPYRTWRSGFRSRYRESIETAQAMAARTWRAPRFALIGDEGLSDGEIRALHEAGTCYVSLTRTEGWGMGAFEAARLGRPVVMTGYGGQRDFLSPEDAWLLDYRMIPVVEPLWRVYKPGDRWADPSVAQAVRAMREVVRDPQGARARGARLAARIAERFDRASTVRAFVQALSATT